MHKYYVYPKRPDLRIVVTNDHPFDINAYVPSSSHHRGGHLFCHHASHCRLQVCPGLQEVEEVQATKVGAQKAAHPQVQTGQSILVNCLGLLYG